MELTPFVRREGMNKMNDDRNWRGYSSGVFNSSPTVEQHMAFYPARGSVLGLTLRLQRFQRYKHYARLNIRDYVLDQFAWWTGIKYKRQKDLVFGNTEHYHVGAQSGQTFRKRRISTALYLRTYT